MHPNWMNVASSSSESVDQPFIVELEVDEMFRPEILDNDVFEIPV